MSSLINYLEKTDRPSKFQVRTSNPTSPPPRFLPIWLIGFFFFTSHFSFGQIQFKVELLSDNVTYQVSMLPSVTWPEPDNITATAQVTVIVPIGGFSVSNVTSLVPGTFWANNGFFSAPMEAPDSDYFVFGLTSLGTDSYTYESGVEVPLFTFVNNGICTGPVEIMKNDDPFFPPNSMNANVSTQITTAGSGSGNNAFTGPYQTGSANCLADAMCTTEFRVEQLGDGGYSISLVSDTAWNAPLNTTDTLIVTMVAPTGSVDVTNIQNIQAGANFDLTASYLAPPEASNFDYFVFELTGSTNALSYQRTLILPLFSFENGGTCEGDSLFLMNNETDPFAMPNSQNVMVGQFIKTVGSGALIEGCTNGVKQQIAPNFADILTSDLTDCESDNGLLTIEISSFAAVEYSIDTGMVWQDAKTFPALEEGNYFTHIRYKNGTCEMAYSQNPVVIETPIPPTINGISVNDPNACSSTNGFISINATSTIFPDYSIDGGQTWQAGNLFSGLGVGTYAIAVRNSNLTCEIPGDTILLEFNGGTNPVIDTVIYNDVTTCNAFNGGINITATGDDLEYSIDNGENWSPNASFIDLESGFYSALVRNSITGCAEVYQDNPIIINTPDCNNCIAEYQLELLSDGRFLVSLIPFETWQFPNNYTSTAQVTIVVPTGSFYVSDLTNLIPDVLFNDNSRVDAPIENPDEDYISFGLESIGTTDIPYQAGVKVPLFTFRNSGICTGTDVRLMATTGDPFAFPNSQSINAGQQLTTIGSGQDALMCVTFPGNVPCIPKVVAENDTINVFINTPVIGNVILNDTSYLNNPMTTTVYTGSSASHGTFSLTENGTLNYTPDNGFTGVDTIQYLLCEDAHPGTCDVATITLIVSGGNQITAENDAYATTINTTLNANVSLNDASMASNNLFYEVSTLPSNGTVIMNTNGSFTYTPNTGFYGFDEFIYKVCDDGFPVICEFATVSITVNGSNQLLAINDNYFAMINSSIAGNVLNNDFNPNGGVLSVNLLAGSNVSNGVLILNNDGTFDYLPNNGFFGIDSFQYVVCNNLVAQECDTAAVFFNISADIMAIDDNFDLDANTTFNGNLITNDLYPNGVNLTASIVTTANNGSVIINANGTFSYTPNIGFVGTDIFQYQICDDVMPMTCDTAFVTMNVNAKIDAIADNFHLDINTNLTGTVATNDFWINGANVTFSVFQNVTNGVLILNPNGDFIYMPDTDFVGIDSFQYQLCDNGMPQNCDVTTVVFTVNAILTANDDNYTGAGTINGNILDNDILAPNGNTIISLIENVSNGTLTLNFDGTFSYEPDMGFMGFDTLVYQICDENAPPNCDQATVVFTIGSVIAVNDNFEISQGGSLNTTVINNDFVPNLNNTEATVIQNVTNGSLILQSNGDFLYIPDNGFVGIDNFVYQLCETVSPFSCDTATVQINVLPNIEAFNDTFEININAYFSSDVKPNDNLPNGFSTTVTLISDVSNGSLTLNPDGTFGYQPDFNYLGADEFEYQICTNTTPPACDIAVVVIEIKGLFLAVDDNEEIGMGETINGNVVDNDIYPDSVNVTVTELPNSGPNNGTLILNPDGTYTYTPDNGFSGMDGFGYIICDDGNPPICDTGFVNINVVIPLTAEDDYYTTDMNTAVSGNVLNNDYNPDNANLTVTVIPATGPSNGNIILNSNGSFTYSPNNGFTGNDQFDYQVCDNQIPQACSEATVYITINEIVLQQPAINCPNQMVNICGNMFIMLSINTIYNGTSIGFEWINGNNEVISTAQNLEIDPSDSQAISPYQVQVTVDGQTSDMSETCAVTVVPVPELNPTYSYSMGEDCAPENLQLIANGTGNNLTYQWSSNYGFYSQQENPMMLNANSNNNGFYEVKATDENGCETTANFEVNDIIDFIPEPIISTTGPVCMGQEIELNTQLYQGFDVDYIWLKNNNLMIGQSSFQLVLPEVEMADTGMYQVMVKVDDCIHQSAEFFVEILETPTLAPDFSLSQICEGGELSLSSNATNAGTIDFYEWTGPNGFNSTAANPIISTVSTTDNGTYSVKVTAENGCQNEESFDLNEIIPIPEAPQMFGNGTICEEGAAFFTIQNPASGNIIEYEWINGVGDIVAVTSSTSLSLPATSPMMISPFAVKVSVDGCASDLSNPVEIEVQNPATPLLEINNDFLCEGESLALNTNPYSGQNVSYQWHFNDGNNIIPLGYSSTANFFINLVSGANSGSYFVIVEVDGCATDTSNFQQVNVFGATNAPSPTNNTDATNPACEGSNIEFDLPIIPGATYNWYGPQGFNSTLPNPVLEAVTMEQVGDYFVIIEFNGCNIVTPATTVNVTEPPAEIAVAGADLEICGDDIITLNAQNSNAVSGTWSQSQWQTQSGIIIEEITNPATQISNLEAGTYTFTWSISAGVCENYSSDEITISVNDAPNYEATILENSSTDALCDEDILSLQAATPPNNISGNWLSPTGATIGNYTNPQTTAENLAFGENIFIWSVSAGACENFSADTIVIFNEALQATDDMFGAFPNDTMHHVNLVDNDLLGDVANWNFNLMSLPQKGAVIDEGNGFISYIAYPGTYGEDEFSYMICSEACPNVCDIATVQVLIASNNDEIYVPNTITPNGDGMNDEFLIPALIQFPGSSMVIFNRHGDEVFYTEDYQNNWEGTYKDDPLPVGTYFYCLQVNNAEKTVLNGYVTIRR